MARTVRLRKSRRHHTFVMRRLNSLRHLKESWGPKAVEWYFWRYVYEEKTPDAQPSSPGPTHTEQESE